ncbi:hypothetical protein [Methylovulum psychrotolerans]|uniref:Uncharacterized protein n=1 Tax=Methylovulum psychrotolerans TaxID=1704499 RepID=A0A2S5CGN6_9GAMM|nr:hypothetical protein [Methylovulum psychrotolerans]POZ49956.1 hypothetical protein AADEFJLK_04236 [Methylovulum psychrotolerans]
MPKLKAYLSLSILIMLIIGSGMDASATPLLDDELKQSAPFNSTVQVIKDAQVTNVEAALFVFTRNVTAGENFRAEVLVLRDPETGLSWWGFHGSSDPKRPNEDLISRYIANHKFYLSDDAIGSVMLSIPDLWFKESLEKYPSMADATSNALKHFKSGLLTGNEHKLFYSIFKSINIAKNLPFEFFHGDLWHPMTKIHAKLESVRKQGSNWTVSLSGADSAKLDVEINANYQITRTILYPDHKAKN